jgi:hypothetical protein
VRYGKRRSGGCDRSHRVLVKLLKNFRRT